MKKYNNKAYQKCRLDLNKERIDYEIEAKRKSRNKEVAEWAFAALLALVVVFLLVVVISI